MASLAAESSAQDRVRQIAVPPAARALSTLAHIDYEDAFTIDVDPAQHATAEDWMRAILERAPFSVRQALQSGWLSIGLKPGSGPPEQVVLGWDIRCSTPEHVLLGRASRIGMPGELLLERQQHSLLFATFVQQNNQVARAVWAGVEPVHVPTVRQLLERASRPSRP
jgi:hypothetical protein